MEIITIEYISGKDTFIIKSKSLGEVLLNSSLGTKCLFHLINNPGKSFEPIFLRNILNNQVQLTADVKKRFDLFTKEDQLLYQSINQFIPATDMKTVIACNRRLKQIDEELAESMMNNDLKKSDDLLGEREFIESYIRNSMNMNGSFRNLNSGKRNATKSIQRSINHTLQDISSQSQEIHDLLKSRLIVSTNQIKYYISNDSGLIS